MLPEQVKTLIEKYCTGVKPSDEQLEEIFDAAFAAGADSTEVGQYMEILSNGPTREEIEAQKAAEAKRKAEEEAKRKAEEEAKRKAAEEEAKRKAEEEAKRKAEEEAKRKAEEEAKRKAEEEAKRKAEKKRKIKRWCFLFLVVALLFVMVSKCSCGDDRRDNSYGKVYDSPERGVKPSYQKSPVSGDAYDCDDTSDEIDFELELEKYQQEYELELEKHQQEYEKEMEKVQEEFEMEMRSFEKVFPVL